jgi:hypothetical protein
MNVEQQGKAELVEAVLLPDVLPELKRERLAELEMVIETDMAAFLRVGAALAEIRDSELYLIDCLSFEEYVEKVWDMSRRRAYQLVDAHTVVRQLQHILPGSQDTVCTSCSHVTPTNEAQIRPLTKFKDRPEILADIWSRAVATTKGKVTAKRVQDVIFAVTGEEVTRKLRQIKEKVERDPLVSAEFKDAYELFMKAIGRAKESGYTTTAKTIIIEYLEAAIEAVNEG